MKATTTSTTTTTSATMIAVFMVWWRGRVGQRPGVEPQHCDNYAAPMSPSTLRACPPSSRSARDDRKLRDRPALVVDVVDEDVLAEVLGAGEESAPAVDARDLLDERRQHAALLE